MRIFGVTATFLRMLFEVRLDNITVMYTHNLATVITFSYAEFDNLVCEIIG